MKTELTLVLLLLCAGMLPAQHVNQGFIALQNRFHQLVDDGELAGTVMLVSQGNRIVADVYGLKDIAQKRPMELNTIFRLASMTKPIVSVAAMMLVEEGKISLDDPVEKYISVFKNTQVYDAVSGTVPQKRLLTVRDLLMHTSGISSAGFDRSAVGAAYQQAFQSRPTSLAELVQVIGTLPLAHQPGAQWTYGHSTDVLALIIQNVSGMPIDRFLHLRLLDPLGMSDTDYKVPPDMVQRFASLYGENLQLEQSAVGSSYTNGTNFPRGTGGLVSTAADYFRFLKMVAGGGELDGVRYIQPETLIQMHQNHLPEALIPLHVGTISIPGQGFGLGFGVLVDDTEYGGKKGDYFWSGSSFTYFFINPNTGTIGIFLSQNSDLKKLSYLYEFHGLANKVFEPAAAVPGNK